MPRNYLDTTDNGLLDFARNFLTGVGGTPATVGLTAAQMIAYEEATNFYADKLAASAETKTRGPFTVAEKNAQKELLLAMTRTLAMQAQNYPPLTDAQRVLLGLTVRAASVPVPPPTAIPNLALDSRPGGVVEVTVNNPEQGSRARPRGCTGASLLSFVGTAPPQDAGAWKFEGSTSKKATTLVFGSDVAAGSCVWVTGYYYNAKGQSGYAAAPQCVTLEQGLRKAGGGVNAEKTAYPKAA